MKVKSEIRSPQLGYDSSNPSLKEEPDLSQLERNLKLTPEERIIEHQNALDLVIELEKAGQKYRNEQS